MAAVASLQNHENLAKRSAASKAKSTTTSSVWNHIPATLQRKVGGPDDKQERKIYKKIRFLGKGGFARVYEYVDQVTGESLAVKITPKSSLESTRNKQKVTSSFLPSSPFPVS